VATNTFAGREALLQYATTSTGSSGAKFGGLQDWELSIDRPSGDVIHQDTSGYVEKLPGFANSRLTAKVVSLSTSATQSQDDLRTSLDAETRRYYYLKTSTAASAAVFKGWGYISSWRLSGSAAAADPQLYDFGIDFDGKVTEA